MSQRTLCSLLFALAVIGARANARSAFAEDAAATDNYNAAELKDLVSPVALYPDLVVASLLPATTYPTQVTEAAAYLAKQGGTVSAVPEGTTWDSSVQALLQYPDLLVWLKDNPDWVAQMGFAVANQQSEVLAAVQAFRAEAQKAGNLTTDSHQVVTTEDTPDGDAEVIVIQPADPAVVYVPTYSPTAAVQPGYAWPWGLGFAMGVTGAWAYNNIDWHANGGDINVSRNYSGTVNTGGNNIGNDVGPNRPTQWNASNKPTQRPSGGVAQPKPGAWGAATGSPKGSGVKPRAPGAGTARPGTPPGSPGAGPRPGAGPARPSSPPAARPAPRPAPKTSPAGGFGGANDGASARATSDRGGASLKSSGGGASGGSFQGQSGRSSGGGGSRSGGGGGRGGGGRRR